MTSLANSLMLAYASSNDVHGAFLILFPRAFTPGKSIFTNRYEVNTASALPEKESHNTLTIIERRRKMPRQQVKDLSDPYRIQPIKETLL